MMNSILSGTAQDKKELASLMRAVTADPELSALVLSLKDGKSISTVCGSKKEQKKLAKIASDNRIPTGDRVLLIKHNRKVVMADLPSPDKIASAERVHVKGNVFAIHDPSMQVNSEARKRLGLPLRGDVYLISEIDGVLQPFTEEDLSLL